MRDPSQRQNDTHSRRDPRPQGRHHHDGGAEQTEGFRGDFGQGGGHRHGPAARHHHDSGQAHEESFRGDIGRGGGHGREQSARHWHDDGGIRGGHGAVCGHGPSGGPQHPHRHNGPDAFEGESRGEWRPGHGRGGGHPHGGPGPDWGGPQGGGRGRARRGEAKPLLLDALRDGPKHGYEIIKALEERSGGQYAPSPGTVYPTLQFLEDLGLVRSEQVGDRRVFELTETGKAELAARADELEAFWSRFAATKGTAACRAEIGFLQDELESVARTAWGSLRGAVESGDVDTIRRVREAVEQCRNTIRGIISGSLGQ